MKIPLQIHKRKSEIALIIFILISLAVIYKDVFLKGFIIFPSQFLATFYSPYATVKYEGFPNGIPHKPIGGNDNVRMFYPYRTFINDSLSKSQIPLWNPYNFAGSPLLADFQSAVFYPPNLIYFILPQITAWEILVVLQPLLGTLFMYIYLRLFIKEKSAAFMGAFSFGFSGFILAWSMENAVVGQSAIWLPLILYAIEKFIRDYKTIGDAGFKYFLLLVASLSFCILSGFLQVAFYIFIISFFYGIIRIRQAENTQPVKLTLLFLSSFLISFLLTAFQLLPSIETLTQSAHNFVNIETVLQTYLLPLRYFVKVLAPDIFGNPATYNYFGQGFYHESIFYLGIIPLIFAFIAIIKKRDNPTVFFFSALALISFILGVKSPLTDWLFRLPIPLINSFTPSRIFYVTSFSLSVLSAFGFSYWLKNTQKASREIYITVLFISLFLTCLVGFFFISVYFKSNFLVSHIAQIIVPHSGISLADAKVALKNIILPLFMILTLLPITYFRKRTPAIYILVIFLVCLGQFYFLQKYALVDDPRFLYPDHFIFDDILKNQKTANRFLSFGLPILSDINLQKFTYSPDGIDPVFPASYGQLIYAAKIDGRFTTQIPRIEANLSEYAENENIIDNYRRQRLISLLGVNRIYNYEKDYKNLKNIPAVFPPDIYTPVWKKDGWQAYQNRQSFPRAFLADSYIVAKNPQEILNLIFDPKIDIRNTIILPEILPGFPPLKNKYENTSASDTSSSAEITTYQPNRVIVKTNSQKDEILFLSDNFYPGWTASIDGRQTPIYKADYTFRAVKVPKGSHQIIFLFDPESFKLGAIITLTTLVCLILLRVSRLKYAWERRNK